MIACRKALWKSFQQYMNQISKDAMLILLCFAPILCGLFFCYGLPFIQSLLTRYFSLSNLFSPYYLLFDLLLGMLTPLMYSFVSAYVILGEIDDGTSKYLAVTPLGKKGYLISRLGFPILLSSIITYITMTIFSLSDVSIGLKVGISLFAAFSGLIEALLVVSLSNNKVEGMAMSKLSGLLIIGIPVPFFMEGNSQYFLFILPSFWSSKFAIEEKLLYLVIGSLVSMVWIFYLYKKFKRKIM